MSPTAKARFLAALKHEIALVRKERAAKRSTSTGFLKLALAASLAMESA